MSRHTISSTAWLTHCHNALEYHLASRLRNTSCSLCNDRLRPCRQARKLNVGAQGKQRGGARGDLIVWVMYQLNLLSPPSCFPRTPRRHFQSTFAPPRLLSKRNAGIGLSPSPTPSLPSPPPPLPERAGAVISIRARRSAPAPPSPLLPPPLVPMRTANSGPKIVKVGRSLFG